VFQASLNDISLLRDSMSAISDLIDETFLEISKEGIKMVASDRTVVSVVDFFLSKNAFSEYVCEKEEKIGLNLLNFMQILRRANPEDKVKIVLHENKLEMIFESNTKRKFSLPLIDISKSDVPQIDKIEEGFVAKMNVSTSVLSSGIEDAELIGDSVIITARKDEFLMASDSDLSSAHLELKPGDQLQIKKINEPVRARYSLDYLKKIIKSKKLAEKVSISMATDYPIKISFDVPDKLRLNFILAPRVEE